MLKRNFLYNLVYQILILIIPLITAPYLSRVIGSTGVGTYSYTYSIAHYFMLLCMLGVNNYGNRIIAKTRDDKIKMSKSFWSIYTFQLLMGLFMLAVYYIFINMFVTNYHQIFIIQSLYIISSMIDINWLFFGLEKFKLTITRNTILKVGTIILIFIFVKKSTDLWKYTLIMGGMNLISQIILWGFVKKNVNLVKFHLKDVIGHIKPNLVLFIPVIAVSIYKMMDKIMLGLFVNVSEVGFYEQAEKFLNIPLTIITALGTVMLPRMANIISKGENEKVNYYISKSITFVMFLAFPMCFGLISISNEFIPIYLGNVFSKSGVILSLLSITLPFISFANVLRTQYLIPKEKDNIYICSVFLGAIVNFLLNAILIPKFASIGASIGTIAAEITVMAYQSLKLRYTLNVKSYITNVLPFFYKSLIMFICIKVFIFLPINDYFTIILQTIIGIVVYMLLNYKYINEIVNIKKMMNKIIKRHN